MLIIFVVKLLELLFAIDVSFQRYPKILETTKTNLGKISCLLTRANATFSTIYFLIQSEAHVVRCRLTALLLGRAPGNFHSLMLKCFLSLLEMLDDQDRASVSTSESLPVSSAGVFGAFVLTGISLPVA